MSEQLTFKQLHALYEELLPIFHSVVVRNEEKEKVLVPVALVDIVANNERDVAIQQRNKQDEEDKNKIRSAFNW